MARIADKHGLTNKYRSSGTKRVVKRGRPRKYLFGSPKRSSPTRYTSRSLSKEIENFEAPSGEMPAAVYIAIFLPLFVFVLLLSLIFPILIPMLAPLVIGGLLIGIVEKTLRRKWNIKKTVSSPWVLLSVFEMTFASFASLVLWLDKSASWMPLLISVLIYIVFSVFILWMRYRKYKRKGK